MNRLSIIREGMRYNEVRDKDKGEEGGEIKGGKR